MDKRVVDPVPQTVVFPAVPLAAASPFSPFQLGPIELRNRIVKTATYEGMTPGGVPSAALTEHHVQLAIGGVGMTTVAYCAVHPDGRTFEQQLCMTDAVVPALRALTERVHAEGARVSLQLGHAGFFTKNTALSTRLPRGPWYNANAYGALKGMPCSFPMNERDMDHTAEAFARSAQFALQAGFDAVELHLGHGYLLSQFLSPATNRRRDRWGGASLDNRMRFPLQVVERVLDRVGDRMAVLAKLNLSDGFDGGLEIGESVEVARALQRLGLHGIVMSGGFTSRSALFLMRGGRPLRQMVQVEDSAVQRLALRLFGPLLVKAYDFQELFFRQRALRMRQAVQLPLVLLGGAVSIDNLHTAMADGFELVAMGRALIADPDLVSRMQAGSATRSRCTHCNQCIAEMDDGGVRCVLDGPRSGGTRLHLPPTTHG